MYAKLVVGNTAISAVGAMRDIGRLITAESPSIASHVGAFNTTSSIVVDNTPAGWTYVGSVTAADRPTIAAPGTNAQSSDVNYNLCFSAPCLDSPTLKYAALTVAWQMSSTNAPPGSSFCLTGAQSATSLGVLTNEGPRMYQLAADHNSNIEVDGVSHVALAGAIFHVIANPRHITIIVEGVGMGAVWESSQTAAHTFYETAPFVQYSHAISTVITGIGWIVPTRFTSDRDSWFATAFNVTDPNTGINYGTYDVSEVGTMNVGSLVQSALLSRANTIASTGAPRYVIGPVFYSLGKRGYPTQYVTDIVPVYWCGAGIASSGDTIDINGETYTFFNPGTGNFGIILQTS